MKDFLNDLLMMFPAVGIYAFQAEYSSKSDKTYDPSNFTFFELVLPTVGLRARLVRDEDGKFVILKGSQARGEWKGKKSKPYSYEKLYYRPIEDGELLKRQDRDVYVFNGNCAFDSVSAAASVVCGRVANGNVEWKVEGGDKIYKEWEAEQLNEEPPPHDDDPEDLGQ